METIKLSTVTTKIGSGATPRGGKNAYKPKGIPLIRSQNVLDLTFNFDTAFIDEEQAQKLNNVIVEPKDVLLNITGDSVARVCMVPEDILPARVNQHVAIIRVDPAAYNSSYLLYYLQAIKPHLLSISEIGGTRRAITKGMIEELEIPNIRLDKQTRIARTLSLLDAKINLLHQQNQTLEAMGAAVFREWFLEGDWPEADLGDFIINVREGVKAQDISESARYIAMEHLEKEHLAIYSSALGSTASSNKSQFFRGDILFGKLRPYFHKVGLPHFSGVCSTDILVLRPKQIENLPFVLYNVHQRAFIDYCTAASGGTRMPRVNFEAMSKYRIPSPAHRVIDSFNRVVSPLIDRIHSNIGQIHTLTNLRDLLLPKLMSGQVRVREA